MTSDNMQKKIDQLEEENLALSLSSAKIIEAKDIEIKKLEEENSRYKEVLIRSFNKILILKHMKQMFFGNKYRKKIKLVVNAIEKMYLDNKI